VRSANITHPGPVSSKLTYWIGRLWLTAFGWDVEGEVAETKTAVLIAAPHTTNWDLPHMLAAAWVFRLRISFLAKHSLFEGLFAGFFRWLGGIPVDRTAPHGLVHQVAEQLNAADKLVVAVPPSGTRGKRDYWKSGFYWIAHTAQVPIIGGSLDYERKIAHLGFSFMPTGDIVADMERIRAHYASIKGKFPENQSRIRVKEEDRAENNAAQG
jgi:1-acyl-sn-glycerol-3-phosphate acyltransferase